MNIETESEPVNFDLAKLIFAILAMVAAVFGFYFFAEQSLLLRVIGLLMVLSMAIGLVYTTNLGRSFWQFALGSKIELKKIVWPTQKETMQTTLIVVVMVLVVGILLWMFDGLLMWGIGLITN